MSIGALKQALEALEVSNRFVWHYAYSKETTRIAEQCDNAITALRTAIEQAEKQEPVALPENAARLLIEYWIAEKYGKEYTYKIVEDGNCWAWWIAGRSDVESEDLDCGTCYIHWDGRIEDYTSLPDAYTTPPAAPYDNPEAEKYRRLYEEACETAQIRLKEIARLDGQLAAAQRQWVGLTDEETADIAEGWAVDVLPDIFHVVRAIEAKLREKNGGQA